MSVFNANVLDTDPNLHLLASVLHPTPGAREEALRRGRERLAQAASLAEAMKREPNGRCEGGRMAAVSAG